MIKENVFKKMALDIVKWEKKPIEQVIQDLISEKWMQLNKQKKSYAKR